MTASQAIGTGLRAAWRTKWMVFLFFGANLLLAAAVAAPMHGAIRDHLGNSTAGRDMVQYLSGAWLNEFQQNYGDFLRSFSIAIAYAGILFLALNAVLSAGAFEVFARGEGAGMHAFGRGFGKYFRRFAVIALVASFAYYVVFWLFNGWIATGLDKAFQNSAVERAHFYLDWVRWALAIFCLVVVTLIVEYAKADVVLTDRESVFGAFGTGAGFVFGHFGAVLGIYLGVGIFTLLAILLYAVFARFFPQDGVATIFLWFLVAQILIWFRWMFRLASWAAAVSYLHNRAPEPPTIVVVPATIDPAMEINIG